MTSPQASLWSYHGNGWPVGLEHVSPMATWPSKVGMHGPEAKSRRDSRVGGRDASFPQRGVGESANHVQHGAA